MEQLPTGTQKKNKRLFLCLPAASVKTKVYTGYRIFSHTSLMKSVRGELKKRASECAQYDQHFTVQGFQPHIHQATILPLFMIFT